MRSLALCLLPVAIDSRISHYSKYQHIPLKYSIWFQLFIIEWLLVKGFLTDQICGLFEATWRFRCTVHTAHAYLLRRNWCVVFEMLWNTVHIVLSNAKPEKLEIKMKIHRFIATTNKEFPEWIFHHRRIWIHIIRWIFMRMKPVPMAYAFPCEYLSSPCAEISNHHRKTSGCCTEIKIVNRKL